MKFLVGRIVHALLVLIAVSILSFLFLEMAPGDYFDQMRLDPRISADGIDALRSRYGVDRPLVQRYFKWAGSVLRGSWGFSFAYGGEVAPLVWSRAANTLLLGGCAVILAWALAMPAGMLWALGNRGSLGWVTSVLVALPEMVLALLLLVLAERTRLFPVGGMRSYAWSELTMTARAADVLWHLVLPVTALALPAFAVLTRHVRSAVSEVLEEPFIANARAQGLPRALLIRQVMRPAANPLIALASLSLASLLSGSLVVEVVMGWPGLGPFLLDAIVARDVHVVIGGVMCSAVLVVAGGLLADLALYLNDPRIVAS